MPPFPPEMRWHGIALSNVLTVRVLHADVSSLVSYQVYSCDHSACISLGCKLGTDNGCTGYRRVEERYHAKDPVLFRALLLLSLCLLSSFSFDFVSLSLCFCLLLYQVGLFGLYYFAFLSLRVFRLLACVVLVLPGVCVLDIKPLFLPVGIQHTRFPRWFFSYGDASSVVTKSRHSETTSYIVMQ